MKAGRWSPWEDAKLREMYATNSSAQIAAELDRSEPCVRTRCWTLGLKGKVRPDWSELHLQMIREAYARARYGIDIRLDELATKLGRTKHLVCRKARAMGLTSLSRPKAPRKSKPPPKWTNEEERRAYQSASRKAWYREHEHPRGALGMKHTQATKLLLAETARRMWADPNHKINSEAHRQRLSDRNLLHLTQGSAPVRYSRCRGGRRSDLGNVYFRSAWEANYARYLNWLKLRGEIKAWEYEAKTFVFRAIKRGTRAYTPDFLVKMGDRSREWHEVKGWMDPKSKTRLDRMARYFPSEKVVIIGPDWFRSVSRSGVTGLIPGWEYNTVR